MPPPLVAGCLWILACGAADWWSGPELLVSALYLPGILWIAWHSGRIVGLAAAAFASVVWLTVDLYTRGGYPQMWILLWNGCTRFLVFGTTAWLASEIRTRRIAEDALQRQTAILGSILDSMREGVVVADKDGRILMCNPSAAEWFGEGAVGGRLADWVDANLDDAHADSAAGRLLRKAGEGVDGSGELLIQGARKGADRIVGFSTRRLQGGRADRDGVVVVFTDLTDRRELEREIARAAERERQRIGRDLHDGLCQELVSISFAADALTMDLDRLGMAKQAASLEELARLVRSSNVKAKSLARGLFPTGLDESLDVALQSLAATVSARSGIDCALENEEPLPELGREIESHLFLILREAVLNAERHSSAGRIRIVATATGHELVLEVIDDGDGIPEGVASPGIGQRIMKYRAGLIGADFEIRSAPGEGAYIRCRIPLAHFSHQPIQP